MIVSLFISHSSHDANWCRPFVSALRSAGYNCFYDEDSIPGTTAWIRIIEQGVRDCDIFVLVLTPKAWESRWVSEEIQLALVKNKAILVLVHEAANVDGLLLTRQWINVVSMEPYVAAQVITRHFPNFPGRTPQVPLKTPQNQEMPAVNTTPSPIPSETQVPYFAWKTPTGIAHKFDFVAAEATIGRAPTCDIVLNFDQMVSRRHAIIRNIGNDVIVADLGSSAGTLVNGIDIHNSTQLKDGDRLLIGETEITFYSASSVKSNKSPVANNIANFTWVTTDGTVNTYDMTASAISIGRAPTCDIVLSDDQMVSRRHAIVRREGDVITLVDLATSNGTLVNGTEIHDARQLKNGDRLTIGDHDLIFHYEESTAQPSGTKLLADYYKFDIPL